MQCNGWQIESEDAHILNDERIDPSPPQLPDHALAISELMVIDQRVDRGIDSCIELVGKVTDAGQIIDRVGSRCASPKHGCAHIDCISAMLDGLDGHQRITCRC